MSRNSMIFAAALAILLAFGLLFTGCDNGTTSDSGGKTVSLEGTWEAGWDDGDVDRFVLTATEWVKSYQVSKETSFTNSSKGTYTVNGSTVTFTATHYWPSAGNDWVVDTASLADRQESATLTNATTIIRSYDTAQGMYTVTQTFIKGGRGKTVVTAKQSGGTNNDGNNNNNNGDTSYTVTFNANGGIQVPPPQTVTSGSAILLPYTTRDGYTLDAWYTAANGGSRIGAAGEPYAVTAPITLYAQWTQKSGGTSVNLTGTWQASSSGDTCQIVFTNNTWTESIYSSGSWMYVAKGTYTVSGSTIYFHQTHYMGPDVMGPGGVETPGSWTASSDDDTATLIGATQFKYDLIFTKQ